MANKLKVYALVVKRDAETADSDEQRVFICDPDREDPYEFINRVCRENDWMPVLWRFVEFVDRDGTPHGAEITREEKTRV